MTTKKIIMVINIIMIKWYDIICSLKILIFKEQILYKIQKCIIFAMLLFQTMSSNEWHHIITSEGETMIVFDVWKYTY
jgi:hypothetical protein